MSRAMFRRESSLPRDIFLQRMFYVAALRRGMRKMIRAACACGMRAQSAAENSARRCMSERAVRRMQRARRRERMLPRAAYCLPLRDASIAAVLWMFFRFYAPLVEVLFLPATPAAYAPRFTRVSP